MAIKRVAIIGSGVAGLCAARHCSNDRDVTCVVFEQSSTLGGTWVYTDDTEVDKHGLPVHSSMYRSLRTNLPKEAMSYPDFPHTNTDDVSYLPSKGVLQYLTNYAEHFHLDQYIQYNHHVKLIEPIENDRWEIIVMNLLTNEERQEQFDGVMICNGHNSIPRYPKMPGKDIFKGKQMHSHNYREPNPYIGKNILVVGAGPSGLDLTCELSKVASKVYLSHHTDYAGKLEFADNVELKPDVQSLKENSVVFKDGRECNIDVVMYCTGYLVKYSFLSPKCKIEVEDNFVKPLYRLLLSIEHPTLCIVGLPKNLPIFHLCHIQSQFYLKVLTNQVKLPSKEEMHKELQQFMKNKQNKGIRMREFMALGKNMEQYYNDLASKAGVENMSTLMVKMYFDAYERIFKDFITFRNMCYKIVDNEHFNVFDMRELNNSYTDRCRSESFARIPLTERTV